MLPIYTYEYLDENGEGTGETVEVMHSIKDDAYNEYNNRPVQRIISLPNVQHTNPAWEWCDETRKYINDCKPKYIRDDKSGVRMKYPKGGV